MDAADFLVQNRNEGGRPNKLCEQETLLYVRKLTIDKKENAVQFRNA